MKRLAEVRHTLDNAESELLPRYCVRRLYDTQLQLSLILSSWTSVDCVDFGFVPLPTADKDSGSYDDFDLRHIYKHSIFSR